MLINNNFRNEEGTRLKPFLDSTGKDEHYTGVYQTIWQRQSDGKWKYVWD